MSRSAMTAETLDINRLKPCFDIIAKTRQKILYHFYMETYSILAFIGENVSCTPQVSKITTCSSTCSVLIKQSFGSRPSNELVLSGSLNRVSLGSIP